MTKTLRDGANSAPRAATALATPAATWTLSKEDIEVFAHALLDPPEPNSRMKSAVKRYKAMNAAQQLETDEAISRFDHPIG